MAIEFSSVLRQAEGMKATGIPIPDSVVAEHRTASGLVAGDPLDVMVKLAS
jgi:hypothetical protein